ncbi:MAG: DUF2807 domain-containing protein [Bacteroidales bacterium]|jgi:hypothetical protein|nr:DUF2807 domain-containing protein [Bacteroidales bacterium]
MKKIIKTTVLILTGICVFCFTSCNKINGNGDVVEIEHQLSQFDKISSEGPFDVIIYYGDTFKVIIEAESNIQSYILTNVGDRMLTIKTKPNITINTDKDIKVHVYCKSLENIYNNGSGNILADEISVSDDLDISLRGSGNIEIGNIDECDNIDLRISGSGNIDIKNIVHCKEIDIDINGSGNCSIDYLSNDELDALINGSGNIYLTGECYSAELNISGSGDYNAYDLNTNIYDIKVNSPGNSHITVSSQLTVVINGSGYVYYYGQPQINLTGGGSGKIISKN